MSYTPSYNEDTVEPICKFYAKGNCRYGSSCFYSHNLPQPEPTPVCKYFLTGTCRFGSQCFYLHPNESVEIKTEPEQLINRVQNLKLVEKDLTTEPETFINHTPASYYEALTGKKLNLNQNLNDLDLSVFDPAYIDYLKLQKETPKEIPLCPYFEKQLDCPFETCEYIHGDLCDICNLACLNPFISDQRETHRKECMKQMESEMEEAFAVQRSSEKQCGICMEVIWQKEKICDRRFGILENCNHCFCLTCIRQWRASKAYENKIVKACPECRVKSDYVTPSKYWFDNEDDKKKIIDEYKSQMGKTECKYFKRDGTCPFGNKCFYLHLNKDGSIAQLADPTRRRRFNRYGDTELYSNLINVNFDYDDYDDYDDDDEYDSDDDYLWLMMRHNMFDSELDDSDFMEFANDFLNLFE